MFILKLLLKLLLFPVYFVLLFLSWLVSMGGCILHTGIGLLGFALFFLMLYDFFRGDHKGAMNSLIVLFFYFIIGYFFTIGQGILNGIVEFLGSFLFS